MRKYFFLIGLPVLIGSGALAFFYPQNCLWLFVIVAIFFIIGFWDAVVSNNNILRNFPVLGHMRYILESISPEIQQYFIERNTNGKPYSREHRNLVYMRAKNVSDTHPFGTLLNINSAGYEGLIHSAFPVKPMEEAPRIKVGGPQCKHPYDASLLNISAMSFGALSKNAIMALNEGAKMGGFYHNTGEGGLSKYHLKGGDLLWEIGTAYFGCRTDDGNFDADKFTKKANLPEVKMISIKLSQGAKPGHGGVLPGSKNNEEIAEIRNVKPHTTVYSPPYHTAFNDAEGLLKFVQHLRDLCGGKPVGFKLCIGSTKEFENICDQIVSTGIYPDFITIDGAEGGTGAAPLEYSDSVGMPLEPALIFANKTLLDRGLKKDIRLIASGKILTAASLLKAIALGADLCNAARAFMFSLGCIQALRCDTNSCPSGVATQDENLNKGLVVKDKKDHVYHFHKNTIKTTIELLAACGKKSLDEVDISMFMKGYEFIQEEDTYYPDGFDQAELKSDHKKSPGFNLRD